jgi:hypothetical protein
MGGRYAPGLISRPRRARRRAAAVARRRGAGRDDRNDEACHSDGDADFGADADLARLLAGIESGRVPVPSEDELRARALMSALEKAGEVDPVVLAAMAGPDGLGGHAFAEEHVANAIPPSPLLTVLADSAAAAVTGLSDEAVLGVISAARRLAARAEYLEVTATAEFTARRQAQLKASIAPSPTCTTLPMITEFTWSAVIPARSRAARIAALASSGPTRGPGRRKACRSGCVLQRRVPAGARVLLVDPGHPRAPRSYLAITLRWIWLVP